MGVVCAIRRRTRDRVGYFARTPRPRRSLFAGANHPLFLSIGSVVTVRKKTVVDFEHRLHELEAIVEALEEGGLTLEEALKSFEHGVKITRECQQVLKSAEQRVALLTNGLAEEVDLGSAPAADAEHGDAPE